MTTDRLTLEHLDALAKRLIEVPPPARRLTTAESLRRLMPTLRKMQAQGHNVHSIRDALNSEGIRVSVRALRQVLRKPSGRQKKNRVSMRETHEGTQFNRQA